MRIPSVARTGVASGIAIVQKIRNSPAPSIRAASSSSSGMPEEELAHQEDAERPGEERQDQARVGVDQAELAHQHEQRDRA